MRLYDTMSEKKLPIKKPKKGALKLFVCGPTVYNHSHLGHARTYLVFDSLVRYWRARGLKIKYLQNITDIDEKIKNITQARKFEKAYLEDMKKLGVDTVNKYARASDYLSEIKKQITTLLKKGYAYQTSSGVYFEIKKFKSYGKLSKQNLDELRSGWRIEPDTEKKDPLDFALWKGDWDKKTGRPGWHIEDTAITQKEFGPQYDLHGAAIDLKFPHHEAEIAQQEAASGKTPFVKHWIHAGFLLVGGEKMSKSKGNFITIKDFLKKYPPNLLRLLVLAHHYRSPINYSEKLVKEHQKSLDKIKTFLSTISPKRGKVAELEKNFCAALDDDFNTAKALANVFSFIAQAPKTDKAKKMVVENMATLGIDLQVPKVNAKISKLIKDREALRRKKDFTAADNLRKKIEQEGFTIED